jgi:hypothetical protein
MKTPTDPRTSVSLSRKEGWAAFANRPKLEPPDVITKAALKNLQ